MRPCRRDANEKEIVEALRKYGATVEFLDLKHGPDLLVGYHGENFLFEIKQKGKQLRSEQLEWFNKWHGRCFMIDDIADALFWIGMKRPYMNSAN